MSERQRPRGRVRVGSQRSNLNSFNVGRTAMDLVHGATKKKIFGRNDRTGNTAPKSMGLGGYGEKITIIRNGLPRATEAELEYLKGIILDRVEQRTPVSDEKKAVHLADAWEAEGPYYSGSAWALDIKNHMYYARFVEEGTRNMVGVHMLETTLNEVMQYYMPSAMKRIMSRLT